LIFYLQASTPDFSSTCQSPLNEYSKLAEHNTNQKHLDKPSCALTFASKAAISASLRPWDKGVRGCRGFVAGFCSSLLLAVVFFVAEEGVVVFVTVVVFSFVDFETFVEAEVPLDRVFAELKAEDFFFEVFEATMSIC
jgi:hypothetical protein